MNPSISFDRSERGWRSEKILPKHYERLAVVYVRQSTAQQVAQHQESTRLQYGLRSRAITLGWPEDRVLVIDDDQGKSGATAEGRLGFQRLVSEVSLDHVGIILGIEMSRLARSCKDWHQLLEICALFGTLIADMDGVYDPGHYNDRLLLGLKGTMSEAELHILRQRMDQGRLNKARRGDLLISLPIGYVRRPSGEVVLDPDEQAQHVVRLIFRKFTELRSQNALLRFLVKNNIQIGVRARSGPAKGELEWHRPNRPTLQNMLTNPAYAGVYAYGRRQVNARRKQAGRRSTGRVVMDADEWIALIPDRLPAYITWEEYERNQAQLSANQSRWNCMRAIRQGPSFLAGLLICAKCGCRMIVAYKGQENRHVYLCMRQMSDYGGRMCQQLTGDPLDQVISTQVLSALTPAALEVSLEATQRLEQERQELNTVWRQRLERAAYEAERAGRQYRVVEPENRLVARSVERDWEEKLVALRKLEEEYRRFELTQPRVLTAKERDAIKKLALDIPALWSAPTTTDADRKAIIRQVIEKVIVDVQGDSEVVRLTIEWAGGHRTHETMARPVARLAQLSYYPQLCERVRALCGDGFSAREIALQLNREGFRPPKRYASFGAQGVKGLVQLLGLHEDQSRSLNRDGLGENEWWVPTLARTLGIPDTTLYQWIRRAVVKARRQEGPQGRLVVWADEAEVMRLKSRASRVYRQ